MIWIGLTGGIATGKSTVSGLLRKKGFHVIDADVLAREAVQIGTPEHAAIIKIFGPSSVLDDGSLDRTLIGSRVFADRVLLAQLEAIIHPRVRALTLERRSELAARGVFCAFYDVPLLFEKQMESLFDHITVVACSLDLQRARLISRNGFSLAEANRRIASQLALESKIAGAHSVLRNDGSLADLEREVDAYLARQGFRP